MFLRFNKRWKDGKEHRYWNIVENKRCAEGSRRHRQLAPFPADREVPACADGYGVQVRLDAMERWNCTGRNSCFAFAGENQHHAIFDHNGCAMVHPSTIATALVALGASVVLIDAKMARRVVRLEDFLLLPEVDIGRENDLRPGELLTAVVLPDQVSDSRSIHLRQGEKDSFDWPIADVAVVLDLDADRVHRAIFIERSIRARLYCGWADRCLSSPAT